MNFKKPMNHWLGLLDVYPVIGYISGIVLCISEKIGINNVRNRQSRLENCQFTT